MEAPEPIKRMGIMQSSGTRGWGQVGGNFEDFCASEKLKESRHVYFYGKVESGIYTITSKKIERLLLCDTSKGDCHGSFVILDCPNLKSLDGHGPEVVITSRNDSLISFCGKTTRLCDFSDHDRFRILTAAKKKWQEIERDIHQLNIP